MRAPLGGRADPRDGSPAIRRAQGYHGLNQGQHRFRRRGAGFGAGYSTGYEMPGRGGRASRTPSVRTTSRRSSRRSACSPSRVLSRSIPRDRTQSGCRSPDPPIIRRPISYAWPVMTSKAVPGVEPGAAGRLPADDPRIFELDLRGLADHWAATAMLSPISAEAMTGADRRPQVRGVPGSRLMEQAGTAVAAAIQALARTTDRYGAGPILILCGPGNNGGDGFVAARQLARHGADVVAVLVASTAPPATDWRVQNGDRRATEQRVTLVVPAAQ